MRKYFLASGGAGLAIALAGLLGAGTVSAENAKLTSQTETTTPIKATRDRKVSPYQKQIEIGGVPLTHHVPAFGMTPKEYGQRYGNGGSKRSNRLRYSHNAKIKRRVNRA